MIRTIELIFLGITLIGCQTEGELSNETEIPDPIAEKNINSPDTLNKIDEKSIEINNEDGPPFSDSCDCTFDYIASFNYNKHRYDLIISGKGWNPEFWSCTYVFGELISNEFPPDSSVTDFRIHLVDIAKFDSEMDSALFESELVQNKLIATQRLWPGDEYTKCKFDPNKTGKYPKPEQWVE